MLVATQRRFVRDRLLSLLDDLVSSNEVGRSIYFPPGIPIEKMEGEIDAVLPVDQISSDMTKEITRSETGAILFWGEQYKYLILPPFPVTERLSGQGYDVAQLKFILEQDLVIALILVRLGRYSIGVLKGENLLSSKSGTGLIHSRHKKGGSSQRRFERHREKQMEAFFTRVCLHVGEQLGPYFKQLDYVRYGGERQTITLFRKQCRLLRNLDNCTIEALLNIREPKKTTLDIAIAETWSSKVIQWREE